MSKNARVERPSARFSSSSSESESDGSSLLSSLRDSKHGLRKLNDRLAWFIDEVQQLEVENARLRSGKSRRSRRLAEVKALFDHELADARKDLDNTERRLLKLELKNERLRERLDRKTSDLQAADRDLEYYEGLCSDLESRYKKSKSEVERLSALLDDARKDLKEEKWQRGKFESRARDLAEATKAKERAHRHEIDEIRSKHRVELKGKIVEIDEKLAKHYETWLKQALQALREKHRAQMRD